MCYLWMAMERRNYIMTNEFLYFLHKFIYTWECVYKKGHYGDLDYVTWEDEDGDPGGITKFGIDKAAHPHIDVKNLTIDQADSIYWDEYQKSACSKFEEPMCWAVYNCDINCGVGRSKGLLAKGAKTADEFIDAQERFYKNLVAAKPKFNKFLKGWLSRLTALRKWLKIT